MKKQLQHKQLQFVSRFGPRSPLAPIAYMDGSAHASENTSRFTGRAVGWFGPWAETSNVLSTGLRVGIRLGGGDINNVI